MFLLGMSDESLNLEGTVYQAETHGNLQRFRLNGTQLPLVGEVNSDELHESWLLVNGTRTVTNGEYVVLKVESKTPYEDYGSKSGSYLNVSQMQIFDEKDGSLLNSYHKENIFEGPTVEELEEEDPE